MKRLVLVFSVLMMAMGSSAFAETLGGERPADLLLPTGYDAEDKDNPVKLLVLLHGFSASARLQDLIIGTITAQEDLGYALLLPDGTRNALGLRFWNAWPECCDFQRTGIDDSAYLIGLIREAVALYNVDPEQVYLLGHSNGGYMSYRMLCDYGDEIAGIVPLAGTGPKDAALCKADRGGARILHVHGTDDTTITYEPGALSAGADEMVRRWAERMNCAGPVDEKAALDVVGDDDVETDVRYHGDCDDGHDVTLWRINGAGHVPLFSSSFARRAWNYISQ